MKDGEKPSEELKTQKDILWGLYQEHRLMGRHNETLRSTVNNMLIVASAALVRFVTYDKEVNQSDLPAALLLIGFWVLGCGFSVSYKKRTWNHNRRAGQFRNELDTFFFGKAV